MTTALVPRIDGVDHIHVYVGDRARAERWYAETLGFRRIPELAFWATDGGPLTISNAEGTVHLALFERPRLPNRATIALKVPADAFLAWQRRLSEALARPLQPVDHEVAWSLYFEDLDGNPFELTSYDYATLAASFRP